jgi:hypothetical protein
MVLGEEPIAYQLKWKAIQLDRQAFIEPIGAPTVDNKDTHFLAFVDDEPTE